MAKTSRQGAPGAPMSRTEIIGGFLFFPCYVFLLPWLIGQLSAWLSLSDPVRNLSCFLVNFLAVLLIFRRWLAASLHGGRFWDTLQAAVLGFAFYYALNRVLTGVLGLLGLLAANPNNETIHALAGASFPVTAVCVLLLAPPVEEVLFRGLIFANLREKSRILAYVFSALLFAAVHVWQYAGTVGWQGTVLAAVQYLPAGAALGWALEKSDTIWAPVLAHAFINAVALGVFP